MPVIQHRRGTASEWTAANPTLSSGEFGIETDTEQFKVGNGTDNWTTLSYYEGLPGPTGDKGPDGDKGATGDKGPDGDQGATGDKGLDGDQGATGDKGPDGDQGATGDKGLDGDQGATGDKGPDGDQGPDGTAGEDIPAAGLDTVGWANAVFIENGATVPTGLPAYTIVIEAGA